jgi:hypothetical protein
VLDPADGTPHQVVTLEGAMNLVGLTILGNPTDASNMRILVCDPLAGRVYALRIEESAAITSTLTSTLTSAGTSAITSTLTSTLTSAGTSAITSALTSAGATGVNAPRIDEAGVNAPRIDEAAEAPSPLPPLPSLPALDVAPLLQRLQDLESARHSAHQSTEDAPPLASIAQAPWRAPASPPVEDDDEPID